MPNASNKLPNVPAASMACCDVRNIDVTDVSAQRSMFFALMPNTTWDFEIDSFRSDAALIDEPIAAVTRSNPIAATAPTAMLLSPLPIACHWADVFADWFAAVPSAWLTLFRPSIASLVWAATLMTIPGRPPPATSATPRCISR